LSADEPSPADAGIVQDPVTGLRGIKEVNSGKTLWYQGNCRDCGIAIYGYAGKRKFLCDDCLLPPARPSHDR
jgi:hypothetical protein